MAKLWETWKKRAEDAEAALFNANNKHFGEINALKGELHDLTSELQGAQQGASFEINALRAQVDTVTKDKARLEAKQAAIVTLLTTG